MAKKQQVYVVQPLGRRGAYNAQWLVFQHTDVGVRLFRTDSWHHAHTVQRYWEAGDYHVHDEHRVYAPLLTLATERKAAA